MITAAAAMKMKECKISSYAVRVVPDPEGSVMDDCGEVQGRHVRRRKVYVEITFGIRPLVGKYCLAKSFVRCKNPLHS